MEIIEINNDYSYLISPNQAVKTKLFDALRFRERNYFHNRRYKAKVWDGYCNFFNKDSGKFLTGLLPEVQYVLNKFQLPYQITDKRNPVEFIHQNINDQFLFRSTDPKPITLYDYQVDLINQVAKHHRGIVFAPTSAGKTAIVIGILKALPSVPTLVLQNRVGLAEQNYSEITNWGIPNVGTLWGGNVNPNLITVASVQSIAKIEHLLPKIRVVIVDEIHDMMSKLPKAVYRRLKNCSVRIAVSATPFKFGESDAVQKYYVKGFFGPVLKTKSTETGILTTAELQKRNILSKSKCTFYPINEPHIPYDIYLDAITNGIAENNYFHDVVVKLAKKQKGRTLILVDRIAHGDTLHAKLPKSLWVQGKDDSETRKEVVEKLRKAKGNVVAIATQQIFNTGISVYLHQLINAASGSAEHLIIQRMGRGLRTTEDKEILNYYDFFFKINPYLEEHSKKRIKILKKEGHEIIIKEKIDF